MYILFLQQIENTDFLKIIYYFKGSFIKQQSQF